MAHLRRPGPSALDATRMLPPPPRNSHPALRQPTSATTTCTASHHHKRAAVAFDPHLTWACVTTSPGRVSDSDPSDQSPSHQGTMLADQPAPQNAIVDVLAGSTQQVQGTAVQSGCHLDGTRRDPGRSTPPARALDKPLGGPVSRQAPRDPLKPLERGHHGSGLRKPLSGPGLCKPLVANSSPS